MSIFGMNPESAKDPHNMSIVDPVNSPSTVKKSELSATDYLVTQCETLLENNSFKYDKCFKQQEEIRLRLIEENEAHSYLRTWLENANKDCLTMKSKYGHLSRTYKILLKNNFVRGFVEHGLAREQLNLKFLTAMMQVEELKHSLSIIDGDMSSLKSEYEEMPYREALLQTEKTLEYAELRKVLRLKSVNVMYECERLNPHLNRAYEEISKINSELEGLTRTYQVLLQDPIVQEFLIYAKYQEKLQSELAERTKKSECSRSSLDQANEENVSSINLRQTDYQDKLITEQRRREQTETENNSLKEFSDKLCHLLYKYQNMTSLYKTTKKITANSNQSSPAKNNSMYSDLNAVDKFSLGPISNMSAPDVNKESLAVASHITKAAGNFIENGTTGIDKRDPIVAAVLSSLSNKAELSQSIIRKPLPTTKVLRNSIQRRSNKCTSPMVKHEFIVKNSQKLRTITDFYCKICDRYYANEEHLRYHKRIKHGTYQLKCAVCSKRFASKWSTLRHMVARHTSLRPYKCSLCDWAFSDPSNLMKHLQMAHNQEKNRYCCAHCGRRFLQKQQLFHHICSEHFSGLLEHVKCITCNKMFATKSFLLKHTKAYHSKIC